MSCSLDEGAGPECERGVENILFIRARVLEMALARSTESGMAFLLTPIQYMYIEYIIQYIIIKVQYTCTIEHINNFIYF